MPSSFVTEPAASAETKVPWPSLSVTLVRWWTTSQVSGDLAARSGCVTSAPVSTMPILIALAARSTSGGHLVLPRRDVLPLVGDARAAGRRRGPARPSSSAASGACENAIPGRPCEVAGAAGQLDLDRLHVRKAPDDLRAREAAQRSRELVVRVEADDRAGRRRPARRPARREDRRSGQRCDQQDGRNGGKCGLEGASGRHGERKGPAFRGRPRRSGAVPWVEGWRLRIG